MLGAMPLQYTPNERPLWFYHMMAFATVLIWSFSFLFIVWINEDLDPVGVVVMRKAIFGLMVVGLLIWRRPNIARLGMREWALVIGLAVVGGPLYHLIFAWSANKTPTGEDRITSALLGLIMATVPIYASFLGWVFLRERLTIAKFIALGLGLGGVVFVLIGRYGRIDLLPRENLEGPIGVTCSAIVGGGISVLARANRTVYKPLDLVAVSGTLMVLMSLLLIPWMDTGRVVEMSSRGWVGITFLGIAASGLAFITWATALRGLQTGIAATYLFLASMMGAVWAWIFRGQAVSWAFIPGAAMVLAGLLIMARAGARTQQSAAQPDDEAGDGSDSPQSESVAEDSRVACQSEMS